ncbi:transcriptional regulator [Neoasaia chiangmaiensis NBRC 101099]|uniref:helix-turn-helix domain-containing protein n=1 Tax=Neoasaia chiangmaiensis TaxID=320497 RepID=UPI00098AB6EE|nr:helix-turn-helix transcriptional regulator [Neoasaia chiangmaiensis]GBR35902.1 transcriptional regulator [Neoasaia chiangmaiensis NBRC 101099]GEN14459.1 XRE family transcriptional regulator [Neoasaia chiangmaiensis]
MDKRIVARHFRQKLLSLLQGSKTTASRFAQDIGVDRSALSQLLSNETARLPRADTLLLIARHFNVSTDWLLGLSPDRPTENAPPIGLEIAESDAYYDIPLLTRWHAAATGTKIRYVPHRLPDILRTPAIVQYELRDNGNGAIPKADDIARSLDFNRRAGTDMEVCLSLQALDALANGTFPWDGLSPGARHEQLRHMARMVDDLYPSFRLFLFDEWALHSLPYTIFGTQRVAIYGGTLYVVLKEPEAIARMQRHFDSLIRHARIQPPDAAAFLRDRADRATQDEPMATPHQAASALARDARHD